MSRLIFKQIYNKLQEIYEELHNGITDKTEKDTAIEYKRKLELVHEDLYAAEYIKQEPARERLRYFIDCGFSYEQTASKYDIEVNAVHAFISRYNKLAVEYLGKETITVLLNGRTDGGFRHVHHGGSKTYFKSLVLKGTTDILPPMHLQHDLKVSECIQELSLLKLLSYSYLDKQVKARNINKLSFLLYILMSDDAKYKVERSMLYKFLEGTLYTAGSTEQEMTVKEFQEYTQQIGV